MRKLHHIKKDYFTPLWTRPVWLGKIAIKVFRVDLHSSIFLSTYYDAKLHGAHRIVLCLEHFSRFTEIMSKLYWIIRILSTILKCLESHQESAFHFFLCNFDYPIALAALLRINLICITLSVLARERLNSTFSYFFLCHHPSDMIFPSTCDVQSVCVHCCANAAGNIMHHAADMWKHIKRWIAPSPCDARRYLAIVTDWESEMLRDRSLTNWAHFLITRFSLKSTAQPTPLLRQWSSI